MTRDDELRHDRSDQSHVLGRRTLLLQTFGAAAAGTLLGAEAGLTASAGSEIGQASGQYPGIALPQGMRLIVTGHDAEGQSYIVRDERITRGAQFPSLFSTTGDDPFGPGPEPEPRTLYATDSPRLEPEVGGANFHFVTLPPTSPDSPPGWHRTETIDMNLLLGGELILMLDKEETTLQPGDVVIQRNTNHAWRNPTDAPVYWAAVLVPIRQRT